MTKEQVQEFLNKHGMSDSDLAILIGVSPQAVWMWAHGKRDMSLTVSRLCRLFDRKPELMREFI